MVAAPSCGGSFLFRGQEQVWFTIGLDQNIRTDWFWAMVAICDGQHPNGGGDRYPGSADFFVGDGHACGYDAGSDGGLDLSAWQSFQRNFSRRTSSRTAGGCGGGFGEFVF
jgi:hypothetical protein